MALWTGGDNALHAARQNIEDQRRVIAGQQNILSRHHLPWPLDPNLEAAVIAGIGAPGVETSQTQPEFPIVSTPLSKVS